MEKKMDYQFEYRFQWPALENLSEGQLNDVVEQARQSWSHDCAYEPEYELPCLYFTARTRLCRVRFWHKEDGGDSEEDEGINYQWSELLRIHEESEERGECQLGRADKRVRRCRNILQANRNRSARQGNHYAQEKSWLWFLAKTGSIMGWGSGSLWPEAGFPSTCYSLHCCSTISVGASVPTGMPGQGLNTQPS